MEDDAVPEWRVKYLNYKAGKKRIKAVSRALKTVNRTPATPARPPLLPENSSERIPFTHYDFTRTTRPNTAGTILSVPEEEEIGPEDDPRSTTNRRESQTLFAHSPPILIPGVPFSDESSSKNSPERQPLQHADSDYTASRRHMNYGSIVGTPPAEETPGQFDTLELPDPALSPAESRKQKESDQSPAIGPRLPESAQLSIPAPVPASDAYHVGESSRPPKLGDSLSRRMFNKKLAGKSSSVGHPPHTFPRSRLRKIFSAHVLESPKVNDVQLSAYRELDARQAEFFAFLDDELDKIETFYKLKEEEASERLRVLRNQLHQMRDRRIADIQQAKGQRHPPDEGILDGFIPAIALPNGPIKENGHPNGNGHFMRPLSDALTHGTTIGKTSKAMIGQSSPLGPEAQQRIKDAKQDYVRHKHGNEVPYKYAKKRLKLALQEFYRALELLKSYALLNRTGFRKINKKYDKAVQARPPLSYMSEKVNNAYFVQSDVVDHHLTAVEDLYARYFERGNHKIAVRKLRSKLGPGDLSSTTFRNGLYVAAGACFGMAGLVDAADRLFSSDPIMSIQTSYLLQLYGGYFLALLLFLIFVLDCRIWSRAHINYVFIFEYDTRHVLDWRELAELPCLFLFLNGIFLYLNFRQGDQGWFYLYWPVCLIALTLVIMAFPFRYIYHRARRWWGYSNWRLLLAGLYPVEFRDFYLGDMYCSQTYAMGQIELFFCLYANGWRDPGQCNSNHSRLLGFFAALPAVWRALQCLRRYYDSRNWFPHLANFAKYCCNILYYMTLSIYRIDKTNQNKAVFISFAAINGVYCSFWDVAMDFSLGNPWAKHPFLRDHLAYKTIWVYYFAMVADVVLRQQWVLYAIFTSDLQHSAVMSFFVSLAEVLRRGMWSLFRVENEHCNNVDKFRASREITLPYEIAASPGDLQKSSSRRQEEGRSTQTSETLTEDHPETRPDLHLATGTDIERAETTSSSLRQRKTREGRTSTPRTPGLRALARVGTFIAAAHAQDFEKRRRPEIDGADGHRSSELGIAAMGGSSDDDDDDDDDILGHEDEERELQTQRDEEELEEANRLVRDARGGERAGV